jgi:ABC-type branched-subunit amino acid transport system substrate-binding protein
MNKKLVTLFSLFVLASFVLAACQPAETTTEETDVELIKIGGMFPFTGALGEFGSSFLQAVSLAEDDLEDAGFNVYIVTADTETEAVASVEAARRLVEVEGVLVLVGAASSGNSVAVAESVTIPAQIPQISYASTSPMLTTLPDDQEADFLFRTAPSDALQGPVLADLVTEMGYTNVSTMYVNNPYGVGLNDAFKNAFEAQGGTVSAEVPHDETGATSYTAELELAVAGAPDAMVAITYPGQATVFLKEALEGNFIDTFVFVDGTKSLDIVTAVGADAVEGMCGTAPGSKVTDSLAAFEAGWEASYGEISPYPFLPPAYDAVALTALAAYEAQVAGEEVTPASIRAHLRSVSGPPGEVVLAGPEGLTKARELLADGQEINFVGASGDIDLDEFGDVSAPIETWCYEAGDIVSKGLTGE